MNSVSTIVFWSAASNLEGNITYYLHVEEEDRVVTSKELNHIMDMAEFNDIPIISLN
jgi:hypothetical protein